MEYFHFVTDDRAILIFILNFQFELDLREYSSMYLKSRGEIFFSLENYFILRFLECTGGYPVQKV